MTLILVMVILVAPLQAFAWESAGSNPATGSSTHVFVVDKAIQILAGDLGTSITSDPAYQAIISRMTKLRDGAVAPDNLTNVALGGLTENDWWSSHFYDPDTGRCYSSSTPYINAEYQTERFFIMALADYKNGKLDDAVYKLGYASHFLADLCQPNHAANNTVLDAPYNHGDFETYIQSIHQNFGINTIAENGKTASAIYQEVAAFSNTSAFIKNRANYYGKISKNLFYSNLNPGNNSTWYSAGAVAIPNTQKALAQMYYRFIYETSHARKLSVRVKTTNELFAGTDDDIYFGMKMSNGTTREYLLDKTTDILDGVYGINLYNDFEQGNDDTYNFYICDTDFDFSKVTSCYIRKSVYIPIANDWKCESVEVKLDDQFVSSVYLNQWFSGNTAQSWSVNGLKPGDSIGSFSVTVKTGSDLWSGTDDNIYFGMQLDNGKTVEYYLDKSGYNDFENGCNDTYSLQLNDPQFPASNIRKVWMRKSTLLGDDWKFDSLTVTMKGKQVFYSAPNVWMKGNTTYNLAVNGFTY